MTLQPSFQRAGHNFTCFLPAYLNQPGTCQIHLHILLMHQTVMAQIPLNSGVTVTQARVPATPDMGWKKSSCSRFISAGSLEYTCAERMKKPRACAHKDTPQTCICMDMPGTCTCTGMPRTRTCISDITVGANTASTSGALRLHGHTDKMRF